MPLRVQLICVERTGVVLNSAATLRPQIMMMKMMSMMVMKVRMTTQRNYTFYGKRRWNASLLLRFLSIRILECNKRLRQRTGQPSAPSHHRSAPCAPARQRPKTTWWPQHQSSTSSILHLLAGNNPGADHATAGRMSYIRTSSRSIWH